jgi:hypothetical protein
MSVLFSTRKTYDQWSDLPVRKQKFCKTRALAAETFVSAGVVGIVIRLGEVYIVRDEDGR